MRVILGLAMLVIVLATIAGIVKTQLKGLSSAGVMPVVAPASGPGGGTAVAPRSAPVVDEMKRLMEAGAASRASEPER